MIRIIGIIAFIVLLSKVLPIVFDWLSTIEKKHNKRYNTNYSNHLYHPLYKNTVKNTHTKKNVK